MEKKRLRGSHINVYKYLMGGSKGDGARLLSAVTSKRTISNGHKLKYRTFHINKRFVLNTVGLERMESPSWR